MIARIDRWRRRVLADLKSTREIDALIFVRLLQIFAVLGAMYLTARYLPGCRGYWPGT